MVSGRHAHTIREDVPQKKSVMTDIKSPRSALLMFACTLKVPKEATDFLFLLAKQNQISTQRKKNIGPNVSFFSQSSLYSSIMH